jgi:hypothetical protein
LDKLISEDPTAFPARNPWRIAEMIFYASMNTEGLMRNAMAKIYLGKMIDSLNTIITDVSDEPDSTEDVLQAYKLFFDALQKELEERRIEKVEIGMALDVTGCKLDHTLEMTSNKFFICSEGKREECTLQDVLEDMYQPEHVIGCVTYAITKQYNRLLINDLKSGIKYVSDLIAKCKMPENSDSLYDVSKTDNHVMGVDCRPITREQVNTSTGSTIDIQ